MGEGRGSRRGRLRFAWWVAAAATTGIVHSAMETDTASASARLRVPDPRVAKTVAVGFAPVVADSGEGRWTALESIELGVPAPVITLALMNRFSSQGGSSYARRLLAMMRGGFGGHPVQKLP